MEERPSEPVPDADLGPVDPPTRTVVRRRTPRPERPAPDAPPSGRRVHRPGPEPVAPGTAPASPVDLERPARPDEHRPARRRDRLPLRPVREGWGPVSGALAPYAGVLAVALVVLAIVSTGLLIAVVGSRQPHVLESSDAAVVDTFGKADGSALGDIPAGGAWDTVGTWEVVAGAAYLKEGPAEGGRGFALLPESSNRARIAATMTGLTDDGGLVTRYQGPGDHVALLPVTGLGTWRVDVVVGGKVIVTDNIGLIDLTDGTRAELVVRDDTAWVIIDGQVRGEVDIAGAPRQGRSGLEGGLGTGASTRFDDVAHEWG